MGTSVKRFGKLTDDQMRKVEKFSTKMSGIGKSATAMGRQISTKVTLPLAAAGAAAFKMASDFESSMTKIEATSRTLFLSSPSTLAIFGAGTRLPSFASVSERGWRARNSPSAICDSTAPSRTKHTR